MSTSGYSATPLLNKLGIKSAMKVLLINPPDDYADLLQTDISNQHCAKDETADFIHLFVKNYKEFEQEMKTIKRIAKKNTGVIIWISWYKKASKIATDITEDTIREYALQHELVDIKVCAVSAIWSGLKLVVPKALR